MPDNYFVRYIPLLLHMLVAGGLACAIVVLSSLVGQHKRNRVKMSPYECGMQPIGDIRQRFSVKFYLVAMLFILFDVEAVFLYPWAILLKELKMFGFCFTSGKRARLTGISQPGMRSCNPDGTGSCDYRS